MQWALQPDKPQQELAGPGVRASGQEGGVDLTKRTRKFLQGLTCWWEFLCGIRVITMGSASTRRAPLLSSH